MPAGLRHAQRWLLINLRTLSQVPRRETLGSTRGLGAGTLVDRVLRFFANDACARVFSCKISILLSIFELG
jgi:hypothetical protein